MQRAVGDEQKKTERERNVAGPFTIEVCWRETVAESVVPA